MKIYARQVPPEYQESPLQMCDEWPENVYVFGNRQFIERAEGLQGIRDALEELAETWDDLQDGRHRYAWSWIEALDDLLPPGDTRKKYTRAERLELAKLAEEYAHSYFWNDAEIRVILRVLEIVRGEEYTAATLRGCCQGDWQNIIYPASYGDAFRDAFETEYFNTGTEWIIHDGDDAPEDPEEIDGYAMYCYSYDPRAEIAAETGTDPADVILYEFDGYTRRAEWKVVS